MKKHTEFSAKALILLKSIPSGKVANYGLIAKLADNPRGARAVGWLLHSCTKSHKLPWHRVVKAKGQLAFPFASKTFRLQKQLLQKEGIMVVNERVDFKKYGWHKK